MQPHFGKDVLGRLPLSLVASARAVGTYESYKGKLRLFLDFCASEGLNPLECGAGDLARYVAYLGLRGTIAAASLRPYLSAVRSLYTDFGLPAPDRGSA